MKWGYFWLCERLVELLQRSHLQWVFGFSIGLTMVFIAVFSWCICISSGQKLTNRGQDDFLEAVVSFSYVSDVWAVQVACDVVSVTFTSTGKYDEAMKLEGVCHLGLWCRVRVLLPPSSMISTFCMKNLTRMFTQPLSFWYG